MPRFCCLHRNLLFAHCLAGPCNPPIFLPAQASSDVLFCSFCAIVRGRLFCRINVHTLNASANPGYHRGCSSLARELFFPEVVHEHDRGIRQADYRCAGTVYRLVFEALGSHSDRSRDDDLLGRQAATAPSASSLIEPYTGFWAPLMKFGSYA